MDACLRFNSEYHDILLKTARQ